MRKILMIVLILAVLCTGGAAAETLRYGMTGEEVMRLQNALIEQGYLKGSADGVFGVKTENAVRAFQQKNKLQADGLAGTKTQNALYAEKKESGKKGVFGGDYSTITAESEKSRIKLLQKALISMNYLNSHGDGIYGSLTSKAVLAFQREHGIRDDGIAGKQTLAAMETAYASGFKHQDTLDGLEELSDTDGVIEAPAKSAIQLLHWYNDIRGSLKSNAKLVIYEPESGLSWTLKLHSRGRHCSAEPLTMKDTQIMLKAFGGKNTWQQKGVYVLLPDGRWTVGATHSAPHMNGYITNNGFDGVVSVHFFRDMEECTRMDPNYGVSNQLTIRAIWKRVSGETVQ